MHIKSIILEGFKSYAQRTEVNGFDPLFNAITGLNGSGKSNILDSICFLLGISNLSQVKCKLCDVCELKLGEILIELGNCCQYLHFLLYLNYLSLQPFKGRDDYSIFKERNQKLRWVAKGSSYVIWSNTQTRVFLLQGSQSHSRVCILCPLPHPQS